MRIIAMGDNRVETVGKIKMAKMMVNAGTFGRCCDGTRDFLLLQQIEQFHHSRLQAQFGLEKAAEMHMTALEQRFGREIGTELCTDEIVPVICCKADQAGIKAVRNIDPMFPARNQHCRPKDGFGIENQTIHVEHDGFNGAGEAHEPGHR